MYRSAPNIYEMLDTLTLGMKEELLEYLKADIAAAKAMPEKSYLEEEWEEIKRLMEKLKYEPYIDDQLEIEEIWEICAEMIKSGKLQEESWQTRRRVLKSIIGGEYYDYYGVCDPMRDLFKALLFSDEEKAECADIIFDIGSDYMKEDGMKLYRELGRQDKYIDYLEQILRFEQGPYMEVISYYHGLDSDKARGIAEQGLKKCRDDQTEIITYLIRDAKENDDQTRYKRLISSAKRRRLVDFSRVQEMLDIH